MESNKNRNTWANNSTKADQDGKTTLPVSAQLREGVIFRAARASYAKEVDEIKNHNSYIHPDTVESYVLSQKLEKRSISVAACRVQ